MIKIKLSVLFLAMWTRPPNFLLVDYYNDGSYPGSVFEVAAQQNNVTYSRPCCGNNEHISSARILRPKIFTIMNSSIMGITLIIWL